MIKTLDMPIYLMRFS